MTAEGWAWLIGLAVVTLLGHAALCYIAPFTYCRKCKGSGQRTPVLFKNTKNYGRCRRCKGSPERLRLGRRFYNWMFNH